MLRKLLSIILLGALIFLSAQGIFSCRSIRRQATHTDSTAVRTAEFSEKWDRLITTDYAYTPPVPGLTFPDLPRFIAQLPTQDSTVIKAILQYLADHTPKSRPVIIRQTVRESGQKQQATTEKKQVTIQEKQTEKKQTSPWILISIGAAGMLIIIVIIYTANRATR